MKDNNKLTLILAAIYVIILIIGYIVIPLKGGHYVVKWGRYGILCWRSGIMQTM